MANEYVSLQDAAARLGVCDKTVRRWVRQGQLTGYRLGPRLLRFAVADLDALARQIPPDTRDE